MICYNDIQEVIDDISPTAFDGNIGFTSDRTGADWRILYMKLNPDEHASQLAGMLTLPDNPSAKLHAAIESGKGDTPEQRAAWTIIDQLKAGRNEEPLRLVLETGMHAYLDPAILWISDILYGER